MKWVEKRIDKKVKSLIAKFTAGGDDERDKTAEALALKGKVTGRVQGRINAAEELGRIGDPQVVPVLVQVGKDKKRHFLVQFNASSALGDIRNPQAIPALIEAFNDKGIDIFTYRQVVKSLIAMRNPQAVPALIRASSSKDEETRIKAAEALGALKDERAVPALIAALNDQHSVTKSITDEFGTESDRVTRYVCDEAALALGKIGDARAVPALDKVWRGKRYDSHTCIRAMRALGEIGGPLALHSLIEAAGSAEDCKEAARVLAMSGPAAFPVLIEALTSEKSRASCGEVTPPKTVTSQLLLVLIEVLDADKDWQLRGGVAALLKVFAEHRPDPVLRTALPVLRRLRLLSRDPVFREALKQIESVTAASKSLPLPAAAPPLDVQTLPRPADAADRLPGTADVPPGDPMTPPPGLWVRLCRALRPSW